MLPAVAAAKEVRGRLAVLVQRSQVVHFPPAASRTRRARGGGFDRVRVGLQLADLADCCHVARTSSLAESVRGPPARALLPTAIARAAPQGRVDRKSTRLNSSHVKIS